MVNGNMCQTMFIVACDQCPMNMTALIIAQSQSELQEISFHSNTQIFQCKN